MVSWAKLWFSFVPATSGHPHPTLITSIFVLPIKMCQLAFCDENLVLLELIINIIFYDNWRKIYLLSSKWYQNDEPESTGTETAALGLNAIWQSSIHLCGSNRWKLRCFSILVICIQYLIYILIAITTTAKNHNLSWFSAIIYTLACRNFKSKCWMVISHKPHDLWS